SRSPSNNLQSSAKQDATALIKPANLDSLRQQKAWELALAPAKNVPMQAFMMYMTGGGVQIFSVMSVWFLLKQALSGLVRSFPLSFFPFPFADPLASPSLRALHHDLRHPLFLPARSLTQQKLVFAACQLALLAVGLWKCNSMGLLPTHQSDWLAFQERVTVRSVLEEGIRGRTWGRGGWV
ncbi:hypothetical protein BCR35DRAFT_264859, partial [Leucosporidium creatinivorum]